MFKIEQKEPAAEVIEIVNKIAEPNETIVFLSFEDEIMRSVCINESILIIRQFCN